MSAKGKKLTCSLCLSPVGSAELHTVCYWRGKNRALKTLRVCGKCFREAVSDRPQSRREAA